MSKSWIQRKYAEQHLYKQRIHNSSKTYVTLQEPLPINCGKHHREIVKKERIIDMGKSLRDRAKQFSTMSPLMEGRDKANFSDLIGTTKTIIDCDFLLDSPDKEYVIFIIAEDPDHFYFGGKVLTDQLKHMVSEGYADEIRKDGLPAAFTEKKAKKPNEQGRYNYYTAVEFFPDEDGKSMEQTKTSGEADKPEDKKAKPANDKK